jgi:hypothetical protein
MQPMTPSVMDVVLHWMRLLASNWQRSAIS